MLTTLRPAGIQVRFVTTLFQVYFNLGLDAKTSSRVSEEMRSLEHTIALFLSRLVPVNQLDSLLPEERHSIIMAHTLAHSATIHLHRSFALDDSMSFEKSSQAAQACITLIKQLSERDFAFLEPMIGVRQCCSSYGCGSSRFIFLI